MSKSISKSEKGQSLVELALSFTVLLIMVGGILEIGTVLYTSVALRDSAQEGVLYASTVPPVNGASMASLTARVDSSTTFPIDASRIYSVTALCNGFTCTDADFHTCQGQPITVTISYNYKPVSPLLFWPDIPLNVSVTNTILQSDAREQYIYTHPGTPKCP
jgi:Flp pilus assembly protein TadG